MKMFYPLFALAAMVIVTAKPTTASIDMLDITATLGERLELSTGSLTDAHSIVFKTTSKMMKLTPGCNYVIKSLHSMDYGEYQILDATHKPLRAYNVSPAKLLAMFANVPAIVLGPTENMRDIRWYGPMDASDDYNWVEAEKPSKRLSQFDGVYMPSVNQEGVYICNGFYENVKYSVTWHVRLIENHRRIIQAARQSSIDRGYSGGIKVDVVQPSKKTTTTATTEQSHFIYFTDERCLYTFSAKSI